MFHREDVVFLSLVEADLDRYGLRPAKENDMSISFLMRGPKLDMDLDAPVYLDMDRISQSLQSGEIRMPKGLTPEERRRYVREQLASARSKT